MAKKDTPKETKEEVIEELETKEEVVEEQEVKKNDLEGLKPEVNDDPETDAAVLKFTTGEVHGCGSLKIRERPAAGPKSRVVKLIKKGTIVDINIAESTETFYKVSHGTSTSKVEGYCMKKYIKV